MDMQKNSITQLGRFSSTLFSTLFGMAVLMEPIASAGTPTPASDLPVRVSRSFFQQQSLLGTIAAQSQGNEIQVELNSPIQWTEEATTQAAPQPGALADFRDHSGCAQYKEENGVAVCFTMMGDVYSLGMNSKDVQLRGVTQYLNQQIANQSQTASDGNCSYQIQNLKFSKAEKDDSQVTLRYTGEAVSDPQCENQSSSPIDVSVQLKRL